MNTPMPDTYGLQGMTFDPMATPQSGNGLAPTGPMSQFDPGSSVQHSYTGHAQMPDLTQSAPAKSGGGGNPNNPNALVQRQNAHIMSGEANAPGQDYMYDSWLSHSQGGM